MLFLKRLNDTFEENAEKLLKEGNSQKKAEQQKITSILPGVDVVRHHNIMVLIILRTKFAILLILLYGY